MRPRILDLFSGAGGCAQGYADAGFDVVGVDHVDQPDYPFEFMRDDALEFLDGLIHGSDVGGPPWWLDHFSAVHASPPCPTHSSLNGWSGVSTSPDLIPQTRALLQESGLPYVIENVEGAPLIDPVRLCGQSLGLRVRRHRLFECSFPVMTFQCQHPEPPVIVVGGSIGRKVFDPRRKAVAPSFEQAKEVMGMPWVTTRQGVVNAVPPAYTEHVGFYLMAEVKARRVTVGDIVDANTDRYGSSTTRTPP